MISHDLLRKQKADRGSAVFLDISNEPGPPEDEEPDGKRDAEEAELEPDPNTAAAGVGRMSSDDNAERLELLEEDEEMTAAPRGTALDESRRASGVEAPPEGADTCNGSTPAESEPRDGCYGPSRRGRSSAEGRFNARAGKQGVTAPLDTEGDPPSRLRSLTRALQQGGHARHGQH